MLWGSNTQLYFWKRWPCSVKIQQRDIMSKVSKKDRCLWCLLQIQPYSSSEGIYFLQLYKFPEEWLLSREKKSSRAEISFLGISDASQRFPLGALNNVLTSCWSEEKGVRKPSGFSYCALVRATVAWSALFLERQSKIRGCGSYLES